MKILRMYVAAIALTVTSLSIVGIGPVGADDGTASPDCTQAEALLEKAVTVKIPALLTGNVDKDFVVIMMAHDRVGQRISEIEAKCGKDPKLESMAAKDASDALVRMDEFRNLGTSQ
jgi:uncharacterized protein (DUF305 family)